MVFLTHEFRDMPWLDLNELLIGRVCSSNCCKGCEIDHIGAVLCLGITEVALAAVVEIYC